MFALRNTHRWFGLAVLAYVLSGCANKPTEPPAPPPPEISKPLPANTLEKFRTDLGDGLTLDFQVEKKMSKLNGKSCFAFITGSISNLSGKTLSRKSVLDVPVYALGALLYRDITSPLADIPSGTHADFEMVVSPVFPNGCPGFDRPNPVLRKVFM